MRTKFRNEDAITVTAQEQLTMALSSAESQLSSKNTLGSLFLFSLSVLSFAGAILFGYLSSRGVENILAIVPLALGVATLLCVTLPCAGLFRRTHNTRYRSTLRLSVVSLILLVVEFVAVFFFSPAS
jgi:hypothetical protein